MKTCDRHGDCSFMTCEDGLEALVVFLFGRTVHTDVIRNRCLAEAIECFLEDIVGAIIKETECAST